MSGSGVPHYQFSCLTFLLPKSPTSTPTTIPSLNSKYYPDTSSLALNISIRWAKEHYNQSLTNTNTQTTTLRYDSNFNTIQFIKISQCDSQTSTKSPILYNDILLRYTNESSTLVLEYLRNKELNFISISSILLYFKFPHSSISIIKCKDIFNISNISNIL